MISKERAIEWLGSLTGLFGAALIGSSVSFSNLGFFAYLLSNACWLWYGYKTKTWSLVTMQLGFTATTLLGVYNKGLPTLLLLTT